jgi:hypothetical protein
MTPSTSIPALFPFPVATFGELLKNGGASAAGFHAVSSWLTCPEKSRLKALGLKRRSELFSPAFPSTKLNALDFGSLVHALLAVRASWPSKHEAAVAVLERWRPEIPPESWLQAAQLLAVYDQTFPEGDDPVTFLGVEVPIATRVKDTVRTVRYDGLIYLRAVESGQPELYALERKTSSRSGSGVINSYSPQAMVQIALWNSNAALVERYGRMMGVIFELLVKTKSPTCDRVPMYYSPEQERLALEYLALPEHLVRFGTLPDGTYPKMLHACWGKYAPCEYIGLCHDGMVNEYVSGDASGDDGDDL